MELDFLNLFTVLLAAWLAGWLATRLGFPAVLGELIAGVILGPPLLGLLHGSEALAILAELGVLLMMLYIGMEIDPRELTRASWAGLLAAIGGFFTPFALAYLAVIALGGPGTAGLFAGIAAGVTSLAVNSRILLDLRILDTRISNVMMAGALVADILSLLVFSAVVGIVEIGEFDVLEILLVVAKAAAFFVVTVFVGLRVFPYVGRMLTNAGMTGRTFNFTLVLILAVLFGELAEIAGLHAILGAFIAGLFLRENALGLTLSRDLRHAVQDTSIGLLTPIFFVTAGFQVSFGIFEDQLVLFAVIFGVAFLGKAVGTALFYLPSGHGWRESLVIGAGMNGRGGVDIVLIGIALEMGILDQGMFSILVFMALLTTATVPVTLKSGIRWLQRRGELVRSGTERTGVIIVGAGPLARTLAKTIDNEETVTMIDTSENHCMICKEMGLRIVHGSALSEHVLIEAQAGTALRLIAMTPNTEVNTLVAQSAREEFLIPEVHVVQMGSALEEQASVREHLSADALFSRSLDLEEWDFLLTHRENVQSWEKLETVESAVAFPASIQNNDNCLAVAVRSDGVVLPVHDRTEFTQGDEVYKICSIEPPVVSRDRFDRVASICPVLDLESVESASDFFALAAKIISKEVHIDEQILANLFLDGETWSSTVVAPGLAIPHILLPGKGTFKILIARSRKGLIFPHEQDPVHIIFVLVGTRDDRNFHLRSLSAIAQIAQDDTFQQRWMSAKGPEELREIVLGSERRRFPDPANKDD